MGWSFKIKNPIKSVTEGFSKIAENPLEGIADTGLKSVTGGQIGTDEIRGIDREEEAKKAERKRSQGIAAGEQAGMDLARQIYGQGPEQFGEDVQGVKKRLQARVEQSGADPVSAAIMQLKGADEVAARREMRSAGVKGMAAANAVDALARRKNAEIAQSLYGQQAQSEQAMRDFLSNMISGTTAMRFGSKAQAIAENQPAPPKSIFGGLFA
jgi:hypothetical protein